MKNRVLENFLCPGCLWKVRANIALSSIFAALPISNLEADQLHPIQFDSRRIEAAAIRGADIYVICSDLVEVGAAEVQGLLGFMGWNGREVIAFSQQTIATSGGIDVARLAIFSSSAAEREDCLKEWPDGPDPAAMAADLQEMIDRENELRDSQYDIVHFAFSIQYQVVENGAYAYLVYDETRSMASGIFLEGLFGIAPGQCLESNHFCGTGE